MWRSFWKVASGPDFIRPIAAIVEQRVINAERKVKDATTTKLFPVSLHGAHVEGEFTARRSQREDRDCIDWKYIYSSKDSLEEQRRAHGSRSFSDGDSGLKKP